MITVSIQLFYSIVIEIHVKDLKHLSDIMTSIEADTDIATVIRTKEFIEAPSNQKIQSLSNYWLSNYH